MGALRVFCMVACFTLAASWAPPLRAEALVSEGKRDGTYWGGHVGATFAVFVLGAIAGSGGRSAQPGPFSDAASALSMLELILPVPALATGNGGPEFRNAMLIYGESLVGGFALNGALRHVGGGTGAAVNFAAATTSSYLFQETGSATAGFIWINWGVQLGLAGASTALAARAAPVKTRYFALLESVLGVGVGLIPPAVSGADMTPTGPALIASAAGMLVGLGVALLPSWRVPGSGTREVSVVPLQLGEEASGLGLVGRW